MHSVFFFCNRYAVVRHRQRAWRYLCYTLLGQAHLRMMDARVIVGGQGKFIKYCSTKSLRDLR